MALPAAVNGQRSETDRLDTYYLEANPGGEHTVVFLHGNASSSRFFAELMAEIQEEYHAIAPDFRGFGDSERRPIDATRGLRDFADDVHALLSELDISSPSLVGWSTGGGVALQYAIDHPHGVDSLGLINPVPPYGYGGTKRDGTPCQPDYAGTGGGLVNEEFVEGMANDYHGDEGDASPRNVLNTVYTAATSELDPAVEDDYVAAITDTEVGDDYYPGDQTDSEHWPGMAPGERGVNNALSPKYCDLTEFVDIDTEPPVCWIRGSEDLVVANGSLFEAGYLGQIGELPGWPGEEEYPPQPMVAQTRDLLDEYEDAGGEYDEIVIDGAGHSPHIEQPETVLSALTDGL